MSGTGNICEFHPSKFGNYIVQILKQKSKPLTLKEIVKEISKAHELCEGTIRGPVKKMLQRGVEDGFIYCRNHKYSLNPIEEPNGDLDQMGDTSDSSISN